MRQRRIARAGRDGFSPNAEDLRGIFAANIPAETADLDSAWKSAVCKDLNGGECSLLRTILKAFRPVI
jgi:hypothetical protein